MPNHRQNRRRTDTSRRTIAAEVIRSDDNDRTVELSFSSEYAYDRGGNIGLEVLDHGADSADLSRLNATGVVLYDHKSDKVVGKIERAWIEGRRGKAIVRFGRTPFATEVFENVKDGILRGVSFGYRVAEYVRRNGMSIAKKWIATEISIVPTPADVSVGVGRSYKQPPTTITMQTDQQTEELKQLRRERSIRKCAGLIRERGYSVSESDVQTAIDQGLTDSDFMTRALDKNSGPSFGADTKVLEEMQGRERRSFSVRKAISGACSRSGVQGFEREVMEEFAKRSGIRSSEGILIPYAALNTRSMTAGSFNAGGSFVPTDKGNLIEKLDPIPVLERAGATTIRGLGGPISFPKHDTGAVVHWLSENAEVPESTPGTSDVMGSPHRVSAYTELSRELVIGSDIDAEAFVRQELLRRLNLGIDRAGLVGSGVSGEPKGIFHLNTSTSGIQTVTFGAAPSWAKIVEFESKVQDADEGGALAWIMRATTKGKWKVTAKESGEATYLADGSNSANGYPIFTTTQIKDTDFEDRAILGNWAQLMILMFGGIELLIDQSAALHRRGMLGTTILAAADIAVRHPESFCVSTDSAVQ